MVSSSFILIFSVPSRMASALRRAGRHDRGLRAERDQREVPQDELPEPTALLSVEESDEIENRHTFLIMMHGLPLNQRQVMAWTYDGYQPTEIAALLGKDPATVRSTLRDARAALKRKYRPAKETP
jgi:RNA polymerase sigma-70 factor (ECF subfamily)